MACLGLLAAACAGASGPPPTPIVVTVLVTAAPSPAQATLTRTPVPVSTATPIPSPRPTLTPVPPETPQATPTPVTVRIATDASDTYLYNGPEVGNRIASYPVGTPLQVIGNDVEGDGLTWHYVRAPDGTQGYIPVGDTVPQTAGST